MKYTNDQLAAMARRLLKAKQGGDMRYLEFVTQVMIKSGRTAEYVEQVIGRFAGDGV